MYFGYAELYFKYGELYFTYGELYFTYAHTFAYASYMYLDMIFRCSHRALTRNALRRKLTVDGNSDKERVDLNLHLHSAAQVTSPSPMNVSSKFTILHGATPYVCLKRKGQI